MPTDRRSVALLIETSNEYARGLLRGILRFQHEHDYWLIDLPERHRGAAPPNWLDQYRGDGIIARIETPEIADAVERTGKPIVDVSAARMLPQIPWVETDDAAIAALAIEHLLNRGFKHLAFCGQRAFNWSRWRCEAFESLAAERGLAVATFDLAGSTGDIGESSENDRLRDWLAGLPEQTGLFAAYDILARRVLDLCRQLGRDIPESIAVLGVDDDPIMCQLSQPPLTSIIPDAEEAGYRAAVLLDRQMAGEPLDPDEHSILLPPLGIAPRRSTDTLATEDAEVAEAARLIRARACEGIRVSDIVEDSPLSRRVLETRFKKSLGMTPHELIAATRLARAEELLRDTDLSLGQIARRIGLESGEYLNVLFRRHRDETPGEYRRKSRAASRIMFSQP